MTKGAVTPCNLSRNFAATQVVSETGRSNMPGNQKIM